MFHLRRFRVLIVHILPYLAIGAAVALSAAAITIGDSPFAGTISDYSTVAAIIGTMSLMQRHHVRVMVAAIDEKIMLMGASGAADAIHAHLGPDSIWRLNLIKEVADALNDDREITLAALEGGVLDLSQRLTTLERALRNQHDN